MATSDITLAGIAGIVPKVSTFADVKRLLGDGLVCERLPAHHTKNKVLPAKVLLRHPNTGIVAVFVDTGGELPSEAVVTVVGVEQSGSLSTAGGLQVGMAMADTEKVLSAGYCVLRRTPVCVEVVAADGSGENYLGIHEEEGKVVFLGLYRREAEQQN